MKVFRKFFSVITNNNKEGVRLRSILKLKSSISTASSRVVNILAQRCSDALAPVKLIPGQLRALSNKSLATTPNSFVAMVLLPLTRFLDSKYRGKGEMNDAIYSKIKSGVFDVIVERLVNRL